MIVRNGGVERTKGTFEDVEDLQWRKMRDGMPACREEALPLMRVLERRLRSSRECWRVVWRLTE